MISKKYVDVYSIYTPYITHINYHTHTITLHLTPPLSTRQQNSLLVFDANEYILVQTNSGHTDQVKSIMHIADRQQVHCSPLSSLLPPPLQLNLTLLHCLLHLIILNLMQLLIFPSISPYFTAISSILSSLI